MAQTTPSYTRDDLIARADALVPRLRERGEATSAARKLPAETIADFWDAGLWYLLKPKRFGGPEVRVDTVLEVASVLARGDGSAAWVWTVTGIHDLFVAYFPLEAQQEYWAKDRTISASSFAPGGKLVPSPGGFTLTGKWSFCSGIDHAPWMLLGAVAGMVSTDPPIPDVRFVMVPIADCRIIDDWHVMGLRGTGSKSVAVEDRFVPAHRVIANADLMQGTAPGTRVHDGPLYRAPTWAIFPFVISSPAAGIAQGACAHFIAEMKARAASFDQSPLARKPSIQMRVAEATALADASELLYRRSLAATIDKVMAGETLSLEHRLRSRRDQAYSVVMAKRAATLLFEAQGGGGLYERGPVQRAMRDLNALAGHIVAGWDIPAINYGQVILGGPPTDFFF
jgi:alkylation response protein AidB-like acyl-CoA dehydrogenase